MGSHLDTPPIEGPGPGIDIGGPVIGGHRYDILFVDGFGNLGQNDNFYYNPDIGFFQVGFNNGTIPFQSNSTGTTIVGDWGTDVTSGNGLSISDDFVSLGNDGTTGNGTVIVVDDRAEQIILNANNSILVPNLGGSGAGYVAVDNTGLLSFSAGAPASIAIGDAVVGGDAWDVLFVDGSGNLGQNDLFTYQIGTQFNVQLDTGAINIDDTSGTTTIKSYGLRQLSVSDSTGIQQFGDLDGDWAYDMLKIDGPNRLITIQDDNEPYLSLDVTNQIYQMGDIGGVNNNSVIAINDGSQSFIYSTISGSFIVIDPVEAGPSATYQFGDTGGTTAAPLALSFSGGNTLEGTTLLAEILDTSTGYPYFQIDREIILGPRYRNSVSVGDVNQVSGLSLVFTDNESGMESPMISIRNVILGDTLGNFNNTYVFVDDAAQQITLSAVDYTLPGLGGSGSGYVAVDGSGNLSWSSGTVGAPTLSAVLAVGDAMGGYPLVVSSYGDPLFSTAYGSMMYTDAVGNPVTTIRDISGSLQTIWMYDSDGQIITTDVSSNPYFQIGTVTGYSTFGSPSAGNMTALQLYDSTATMILGVSGTTVNVPSLAGSGQNLVAADSSGNLTPFSYDIPVIVAVGNLTGQTGVASDIVPYTNSTGGARTYRLSIYLNIVSITGSVGVTVTFTDENSNIQNIGLIAMGSTVYNNSTPGFIAFPSVPVRVKDGTSINVSTTFSGTGSYDIGASVEDMQN